MKQLIDLEIVAVFIKEIGNVFGWEQEKSVEKVSDWENVVWEHFWSQIECLFVSVGKLSLSWEYIWLGKCRLEKCLVEKMSVGKMSFGKMSSWENVV